MSDASAELKVAFSVINLRFGPKLDRTNMMRSGEHREKWVLWIETREAAELIVPEMDYIRSYQLKCPTCYHQTRRECRKRAAWVSQKDRFIATREFQPIKRYDFWNQNLSYAMPRLRLCNC